MIEGSMALGSPIGVESAKTKGSSSSFVLVQFLLRKTPSNRLYFHPCHFRYQQF